MNIIQMLVWILFSLSTSTETSVGGTVRSPVTSQGPFLLRTTDWGEDNGIAADTSLRPSDLNVAIWATRLHWQDKHRNIPCLYLGWVSSYLISSPPGSLGSVRRFHNQEVKEMYPCYGLESPIISKLVQLNYMLSSYLPLPPLPSLPHPPHLLSSLFPSLLPPHLFLFSPQPKKKLPFCIWAVWGVESFPWVTWQHASKLCVWSTKNSAFEHHYFILVGIMNVSWEFFSSQLLSI